MEKLLIGGTEVTIDDAKVSWTSGMNIDADGAPMAYSPVLSNLPSLDALANAGHPDNWWGIVTKNGKPTGEPVVQGPTNPAPGYYVSPTSLCDRSKSVGDPLRYVDSSSFPYISVPPELIHKCVHIGDVVIVKYGEAWSPAVVADVGPHGKIGEGSIALAKALGIPSNARHGGVDKGVAFTIYIGSTQGHVWPRKLDDIAAQVLALGGIGS